MTDTAVAALKREHALELRAIAKKIGDYRFRDTSTYLEQMDDLRRHLIRRADDIVHPQGSRPSRSEYLPPSNGVVRGFRSNRVTTVQVRRSVRVLVAAAA